MSARKRKPKATPKRGKPAPAPAEVSHDRLPVDETLESNAPRDVEIQEGEPSELPLDPADLPTLEMPALDAEEAWAKLDPEATVDLRGPMSDSAAVRDDAEDEVPPSDEVETVEVESLGQTDDDEAEATDEPVDDAADNEVADGTGENGAAADDAAGEAQDENEAETTDDTAPSATDRERANLKGLVEALVFATDKPIKVGELARLADAAPKLIRVMLAELTEEYKPRGIQLGEVAGGYLFRTNVRYGSFVRELTQQKPIRLSRAQLEALAILAYRQPITRPEIDEIRGVDSGPVLKMLLERELVRILGKRDEVGRPIIYGTTPEFLEFFGLKSLKDLPNLREFTELTDESHAIAEKELGESWRGPSAAADEGELPDAGETAALDAEAERIVNDSMVDHVLPDTEPVFEDEDQGDAEDAEGSEERESEEADTSDEADEEAESAGEVDDGDDESAGEADDDAEAGDAPESESKSDDDDDEPEPASDADQEAPEPDEPKPE